MKKIIKKNLFYISRIVFFFSRILFYIIPVELKKDNYLEKILKKDAAQTSFRRFNQHIKKSIIFKNINDIRNYAIINAINNEKNKKENDNFYLEFGVWKGESTNFFSNYGKKINAFDSFRGLTEDWKGQLQKGSLSLDGQPPKLAGNVELIIGNVEETLKIFLDTNKPKINFVHFDLDTYGSTKYVLKHIKPFLENNCTIIFDQFYNFIGWEEGEYKALEETFDIEQINYRSFSIKGTQVVIEIKR